MSVFTGKNILLFVSPQLYLTALFCLSRVGGKTVHLKLENTHPLLFRLCLPLNSNVCVCLKACCFHLDTTSLLGLFSRTILPPFGCVLLWFLYFSLFCSNNNHRHHHNKAWWSVWVLLWDRFCVKSFANFMSFNVPQLQQVDTVPIL